MYEVNEWTVPARQSSYNAYCLLLFRLERRRRLASEPPVLTGRSLRFPTLASSIVTSTLGSLTLRGWDKRRRARSNHAFQETTVFIHRKCSQNRYWGISCRLQSPNASSKHCQAEQPSSPSRQNRVTTPSSKCPSHSTSSSVVGCNAQLWEVGRFHPTLHLVDSISQSYPASMSSMFPVFKPARQTCNHWYFNSIRGSCSQGSRCSSDQLFDPTDRPFNSAHPGLSSSIQFFSFNPHTPPPEACCAGYSSHA